MITFYTIILVAPLVAITVFVTLIVIDSVFIGIHPRAGTLWAWRFRVRECKDGRFIVESKVWFLPLQDWSRHSVSFQTIEEAKADLQKDIQNLVDEDRKEKKRRIVNVKLVYKRKGE